MEQDHEKRKRDIKKKIITRCYKIMDGRTNKICNIKRTTTKNSLLAKTNLLKITQTY